MPLVTSKGFNLVPDTSSITNRIAQAIQQNQLIARQDEQLAQKDMAQKAQQVVKTAGAQALRVRGIDDFMTQRKEIAILAQNAVKRGEDPKGFVDALNIQNQDEFNLNLTRIATRAGDADKLISEGLKQSAETGSVSEVQSSKILPGGVTQIVRKDGTTEVVEADALSSEIVKRAESRGVDLQQQRAQGRGLGKDAAKIATKMFDKSVKLRANNRTLKKVITAIGEGAETGPLTAKLPSLRAASIKLDQVRSELGLDVVGSVTFGALSEGELNLAMSTALPTKLEGPELVKWANDKVEAQEKLIEYMEDQAVFLSEKGNTSAMWLTQQRDQAPKAETAQPDSAAAKPKIKFLGFE